MAKEQGIPPNRLSNFEFWTRRSNMILSEHELLRQRFEYNRARFTDTQPVDMAENAHNWRTFRSLLAQEREIENKVQRRYKDSLKKTRNALGQDILEQSTIVEIFTEAKQAFNTPERETTLTAMSELFSTLRQVSPHVHAQTLWDIVLTDPEKNKIRDLKATADRATIEATRFQPFSSSPDDAFQTFYENTPPPDNLTTAVKSLGVTLLGGNYDKLLPETRGKFKVEPLPKPITNRQPFDGIHLHPLLDFIADISTVYLVTDIAKQEVTK